MQAGNLVSDIKSAFASLQVVSANAKALCVLSKDAMHWPPIASILTSLAWHEPHHIYGPLMNA